MQAGNLTREAVQTFMRSAAGGRLAHAYLVIGAVEGPVTEFTHFVLQYLFCSSTERPCGACDPCRQVRERSHADILWVEPESKSRVIRIEQVRDLNRRMAQSSFAGGWKAGVIMHADRLNESAANAFLKTLEEPAGKTILLLLTGAPQALLPTIVSRCQRIMLAGAGAVADRPWREPLIEMLSQIPARDPLQCARLSWKLKGLLDQEKERIRAAEDEVCGEEQDDKVLDARIESHVRESRAEIMLDVLHWQRDVLLSVVGADEKLYHHIERAADITRQASGVTCVEALARVRTVDDMVRQLERNMPPITVFESHLPMNQAYPGA